MLVVWCLYAMRRMQRGVMSNVQCVDLYRLGLFVECLTTAHTAVSALVLVRYKTTPKKTILSASASLTLLSQCNQLGATSEWRVLVQCICQG